MPVSATSQGLFSASLSTIPQLIQKWLHNQAPSSISNSRLHLHSKPNTFAVPVSHGISPRSFARSLCFLPQSFHFEATDAENQGFQTSLDVLRKDGFGIARRAFSVALLFSGLVITTSASAAPEKKIKGKKSPFDEQRLLEQNKRMQTLNNAPSDFPGFVREGYNVKLVTSGDYVTCKSGLVYLEIQEGEGDYPKDGQQVIFHYVGYNESGRKVDSSYQQGQPAKTRIGINAMIPGFEEGLRTMKPGGKRRLIIPPELGPPVGPSTFFSAKQFEVFDVELLAAKDCTRRTIGFYSDFVCD